MKIFKSLFGSKSEVEKPKVKATEEVIVKKEKKVKMTSDYVNPKEAYKIEKEKRQKENAKKRIEEEKIKQEEAIKQARIEKEQQLVEAKLREERLEKIRQEQATKKAEAQKVTAKKVEEKISFAGIDIEPFSKGDIIKVEVMEESRDAYIVRCVDNFQDAKLLKSEMDGVLARIGDVFEVLVWKHYADEDYVSLRRYKNRVEAKTMIENFDVDQIVSAKVLNYKAPMFNVLIDNNVKAKVFVKNMDTKFITEDNAGEYIDNTYEFLVVEKFEDALPNQALFELNRRDLVAKLAEEKIKQFKIGSLIEIDNLTANKGGLSFEFQSIRGFIPMSEISHSFVQNSEDALANIQTPITVRIIEIKKQRGQYQLVCSIKQNLISPFDLFLNDHKIGDIIDGHIIRKEKYGIILSLTPDFNALLHESDFSMETATLFKAFKEGAKITVKIKGIDFDKSRVIITSNLNDGVGASNE